MQLATKNAVAWIAGLLLTAGVAGCGDSGRPVGPTTGPIASASSSGGPAGSSSGGMSPGGGATGSSGGAASSSGSTSSGGTSAAKWIGAWATAIYGPYPVGALSQAYVPVFPTNEVLDQSLRMIVHPSIGADTVRACFSNLHGDEPLQIASANLALSTDGATAAITDGSAVPLRFDGQPSVAIAPGAKRCSDGAAFHYAFGDNVAVSFQVPGPGGPISWHSEAFATQWVSAPMSGDVTADASGAMFPLSARSFFYLSDLEVVAPTPEATTISVFGDSITDGFVSTIGLNQRYPDFLARRLQTAGFAAGVRNLGINGNTVGDAHTGPMYGDPALIRFQRDALAAPNVKSVFVLIGTNDIGSSRPATEVYAGLLQLAAETHAAGACIVVSTVLPRDDPPLPFGWDITTEEPQRQALNQMILASTAFDTVVDVAAAMASPLSPNLPDQPYFVEGLHPNSLGMERLANAIPLAPLLPAPIGSCKR